MIVLEAIVPHNPLLIDAEAATETHEAFVSVSALLSQAEPDVVVFISEHVSPEHEAFTTISAPTVAGTLKEFGHATERIYKIDVQLAAAISHAARLSHIPLQQSHAAHIDYGTALVAELLEIDKPIVVLGTSSRSILDHAFIGEALQEVFQHTNKRIAILVTGDCSHTHADDTRAGYSQHGADFDEEFKTIITTRSIAALATAADKFDQSQECISRAAAMGFGMIRKFPTDTHVLSYEVTHGVGLLTAFLFIA